MTIAIGRYASIPTSCAAAAALLALSSSAFAQQDATPSREAAPVASKYAGVYHTATGTWTRRPVAAAAAGPDVIYCNTAASAYFSAAGGTGGFAPGSENFDEGGIPTTANTGTFPNPVDRDVYTVNGYQLNYCDFNGAGTGGWEISFYESYAPCTNNVSPTATITTTQLPAGGGCWIIDIDLAGGQEFQLAGDGGDGFQNDPALDSFGWSYTYAGSEGSLAAGMFLAADPVNSDPGYGGGLPVAGTGTYYGGPSACSAGSTGYLTQDFWWLEDPTGTNSNCFFFGGYSNMNPCNVGSPNPYASWYFELYAEAGAPPSIGLDYCQSNPNMTGVTTLLEATGSAVAADDNVTLIASRMAPGTVGYFITSQTQGFVANPGGSSGNLCVVSAVGRFLQNPGQFKAADADGVISLSTVSGEWSLTRIPTALPPLSYSAMVGITSNFQLWHRDTGGSNFSNGLSVDWQ